MFLQKHLSACLHWGSNRGWPLGHLTKYEACLALRTFGYPTIRPEADAMFKFYSNVTTLEVDT